MHGASAPFSKGTSFMERTITCESVFRGHPDKICDQIADAILDEYLVRDRESRVAIECSIKDNLVLVFGEVTSKARVDVDKVARRVLRDIGYFDNFVVLSKVSAQSWDIAKGVDREGAGDQGIMYGYATDETESCLPLPYVLARSISMRMDALRRERHGDVLGPDGKCQVSVRYVDGRPKSVETIVVSAQHRKDVAPETVRAIVRDEVLAPMLGEALDGAELLVNPTGSFYRGGPYADSGLTGRKLMVDTYGGIAHHGGGAFSGKDPTKVDRSGAYYARHVAKSVVRAGLARRCEVAVSYSIGVARPVCVSVDTFGTGRIPDERILALVEGEFDFSPAAIIAELGLRDVSYYPLAQYGHFGNDVYPWEKTDGKAKRLQEEASA